HRVLFECPMRNSQRHSRNGIRVRLHGLRGKKGRAGRGRRTVLLPRAPPRGHRDVSVGKSTTIERRAGRTGSVPGGSPIVFAAERRGSRLGRIIRNYTWKV